MNAVSTFSDLSQARALLPEQRILLCSDGVWGALDGPDLQRLLGTELRAESIAQALVSAAIDNGSSDNCSALVILARGA